MYLQVRMSRKTWEKEAMPSMWSDGWAWLSPDTMLGSEHGMLPHVRGRQPAGVL